MVLGFLVPGLKEILIVGAVALMLYGRSGSRLLSATKYGKTLGPWLDLIRIPEGTRPGRSGSTPKRTPPPPPSPAATAPRFASLLKQGRWFWAMVITVAAAVAAWVATRVVMHSSARGF